MTDAERTTAIEQITAAQARIVAYDAIQEDIARLEGYVGNVYQVGFITASGDAYKVSDPLMVTKGEAAIVKLIAARKADQVDL